MLIGFENELWIGLSVLILLYAETHYSFRGIYSSLKKQEPEIIADAPHRLEPNVSIPLLLLIKDANVYPVVLKSVEAELRCGTGRRHYRFDLNSVRVSQDFWYQIFDLQPPGGYSGDCTLDVSINYAIGGSPLTAKNDNYNGTGHQPLEIHISEKSLPRAEGWHFGEFHCHSSYTSDQVEFGAPLMPSMQLARQMGLSFFCATDHSYDLDDQPDDYLANDPDLKKWQQFQTEVRAINEANSDFVIVPGEEVSAGNSKNRNVHLVLLNHPHFVPGDGDGAERWLRTKPTLPIAKILETVNSNSATFAAHPGTKPPLLQKLLVRRGTWEWQDVQQHGLNGLQIWNGTDDGFGESKELWVKLLLTGRRVFMTGGNDAHGNFNRFRQIGLPFFTMRENYDHLFGKVRTGVYLEGSLSLPELIRAFKGGRMVITDGPFAEMSIESETGQGGTIGDCITGRQFSVALTGQSTAEFGHLRHLKVYLGDLSEKQERLIYDKTDFANRLDDKDEIEVEVSTPGYLRMELYARRSGGVTKCLTNPIWLDAHLP